MCKSGPCWSFSQVFRIFLAFVIGVCRYYSRLFLLRFSVTLHLYFDFIDFAVFDLYPQQHCQNSPSWCRTTNCKAPGLQFLFVVDCIQLVSDFVDWLSNLFRSHCKLFICRRLTIQRVHLRLHFSDAVKIPEEISNCTTNQQRIDAVKFEPHAVIRTSWMQSTAQGHTRWTVCTVKAGRSSHAACLHGFKADYVFRGPHTAAL